jgi:cell wall-associated NlpC family hydrolase
MPYASKVATVAATALILPIVFIAAIGGTVAAVFGSSGASGTGCITTGASADGVTGYSPDQIANAALIVAVGKQMHVPEQGLVIAIATAMQESTLRNLDHGDRDSLGLFQQRPSQGWGTPAQLMDPAYAATQFYGHLLEVPDWQQMSLNDAAQAVQQSGTPNAYGQHQPAALAAAAAVGGATCAPATGTGDCNHIEGPNPAAVAAINYACGQRGLPYVWGGNGPDSGDAGFDCSGLTTAAYAAAGISLPRTAHTQYHATTRLTEAELQPGDLVFYGNPNTKIHHVGLYIGDGQMIDAATFGKPVGVRPIRYRGDDFAGGGRVSLPTNVGSHQK